MMGTTSHPNRRTTISTGNPEKTLPKGDIKPFMLIIKPVNLASTLSIAISSLKEKGMYKKNPNKKERQWNLSCVVEEGIMDIRTPEITEVISQRREREIWNVSETHPTHYHVITILKRVSE